MLFPHPPEEKEKKKKKKERERDGEKERPFCGTDTLLHYLMGLTAAMEVWSPLEAPASSSSSSSCAGEDGGATHQQNIEAPGETTEGGQTNRRREPGHPQE